MTHKWSGIAALAVIVGCLAINAGQAFATETLSFVPQTGKFPMKMVTVKGKSVTFFVEGFTYDCTAITGEGEITSHKSGNMKFTLTGCVLKPAGSCKSAGAEAGEIRTGTLPVQLVYISKAKHEAGLDVNYQPGEPLPPNQFGSWTCGAVTGVGVRGSIIAAVTPVNTSTLSHTAVWAEVSNIQSPARYETEEGTAFKAFPQLSIASENYFQGTVTSNLELTTPAREGTLEIKA